MLYTVHLFDTEGRPTSWEEMECASEAEAINATLDTADGRAVELWRGDRRLMWWPAVTNRVRPLPINPRRARRLSSV